MNKILIILLMLFFTSGTVLIASEKDCSEYNKITNWKGWKDCKKETEGNKKSTKKKTGKLLSDINEKYKNLRKEKAPKTGSEIWKNYKKKKSQ